MRTNIDRVWTRLQRTFGDFTSGQKVVAVIGTAALVLAGFALFRWASTPTYAPLYSGLASEDAAGVIDQLDAQGVSYELAGGGGTIMVPRDQVYELRIAMSAEGLPSGSADGGYSLLDDQGLSTSQFQEQTDFKRAMEGELANTIEAIDGVDTAVVHLALPPRQIFADEQDPATASVLVQTRAGSTMRPEQVQAVVNLVSASVDGLSPDKVTVADSTGRVLSAADGSEASMASSRTQQVQDFQNQMGGRLQQMLDRVLGPGNSQVQVTADLSFDKAVTETTRYFANPDVPALSSTESKEKYVGPAAAGASGVLGPDGQMEPSAGVDSGASRYDKSITTSDNPVGVTQERREAAPGGVSSLHIGVVLDARGPVQADLDDVQDLVEAAVGIDEERGDTVEVAAMPFDRTAEVAATEELEAADAAAAKTAQDELYRNLGIGGGVALLALIAWARSRKHAKARAEATSYVVEQLRRDSLERASAHAVLEPSPALAALEASEPDVTAEMRNEIAALVERQPEDVASLLRGWLVERS